MDFSTKAGAKIQKVFYLRKYLEQKMLFLESF